MQINPNKINLNVPKTLGVETSRKSRTEDNQPSKGNRMDTYTPTKQENNPVYEKPSKKVDTKTIEQLKAESEKHYEQLRQLVDQLLKKQGMSFSDITDENILVTTDERTRLEAQQAISDGGPLSPENVSDRIVAFAKAISGGDKSKLGLLKDAIDTGFTAAANLLGGELPDISQTTYDLIMDKLADWAETEED